jgi:hypothetical protein
VYDKGFGEGRHTTKAGLQLSVQVDQGGPTCRRRSATRDLGFPAVARESRTKPFLGIVAGALIAIGGGLLLATIGVDGGIALVVVGLVMAVIAGIDFRRRSTADPKAVQPTMDAEHAGSLRGILGTVESSVQSDKPANLSGVERDAFLSHFPELVPLADEWNGLPAQLRASEERVKRSVIEEAGRRWPGWPYIDIANACLNFIFRRGLGQPVSGTFYFGQDNHLAPAIWFGGPDGGAILKSCGYVPFEQVSEDAELQVKALRAWLPEMDQSPAALEWRDLLERKRAERDSLLEHLQRLIHATALAGSRCGPNCAPA